MTIAPPLTDSPRDRVTLALHRSRRAEARAAIAAVRASERGR